MAEERMVYNNWIADSKTKNELSGLSGSNEKLIEYVFTNAFKLGRQNGYSKGYNEAMTSIGDFDIADVFNDDAPESAMDESSGSLDYEKFDSTSELIDC